MTTQCTQEPDTKPGHYYVSVRDGDRTALLLGPFAHHEAALDAVDEVREAGYRVDPKAAFYAFGTCRLPDDDRQPIRYGKFNAQFGLPDGRPVYTHRIYAKAPSAKRWAPMDLRKGRPVGNLIYASMLTATEVEGVLTTLRRDNPEWTFQARAIAKK